MFLPSRRTSESVIDRATMRSEVIGDFQEPYGAIFLAPSTTEQSPSGSATTAGSTRGLIPAVGVLRKARALYPHNAKALAGRRLHDDPALGAIHHRRAQPFETSHLGGNVVGLDVYVHAALVLVALDLDDRLVCRCCKHAVIVTAHRMVKVHGTAERGGPEAGGLVHVGDLAVNQRGAQAGVVHERVLSLA